MIILLKRGTIFNIQHYSVHDGPGIRTVVFLKGCPLRCKWCANPESQKRQPEIAWTKGNCIGCHCCELGLSETSSFEAIPQGTFRFGEEGLCWDETYSASLENIKRLCPAEALHVIGAEKDVDEIVDTVEKDAVFYGNSGGGLTISGGEPLMQAEFVDSILIESKKRHIHCAMESSGYGNWSDYEKIAAKLDYLLTDIKCINDKKHREWTGVSNQKILDNLKNVRRAYPNLPVLVRTPVIPGVNDTKEEIGGIIRFLHSIPNINYELLKYHRLGAPKYESLKRAYPMGEVKLLDEIFEELKEYAQREMGK